MASARGRSSVKVSSSKKYSRTCGKCRTARGDLRHHVLHAARAIAMAPHRLGPETEGALGAAAAARVERDVGMEQVADEVLLDHEVALIHVHHEGQGVHVLEGRALGRPPEAIAVAVAEPAHRAERAALRDLLDGEVEVRPRHELDGRGRRQRRFPMHGHVRAHEADAQARVRRPHGFRHAEVAGEGRRARVEHGQFVVRREGHDVVDGQSRGGASTSRLPGTSAAGCASHVGYQNERTSRRAW